MNRNSRNRWILILVPFSWLYGLAVWIRNTLFDNGLIRVTGFNIPIISIGNITVGGTGKTPHVEYLAEQLKKEYRVATLSRGYKRKTRDFRVASADSSTPEIGDEPVQMKKRFPDVVVAVDRDRVNGVRELMKLDPPLEAIVLDDAFQHRSIRPGFSILLIDYNRPMVSDHLLPAGRLREPAVNRNRANMILVTKSPPGIKPIEMREYVNRLGLELGQHLFFTTMQHGELVPVFNDAPPRELQYFKEQAGGVLVVSGIADPGSLMEYAREISTKVELIRFPDHHRYSGKDVNRIRGKAEDMTASRQEILILTTEKDATKLRELDLPQPLRELMYAVRIRVHFLNNDKENFDKQIISYVTSNKRSSILHQGTY
jgi:tetraacyldisaccharide 4'-kinase